MAQAHRFSYRHTVSHDMAQLTTTLSWAVLLLALTVGAALAGRILKSTNMPLPRATESYPWTLSAIFWRRFW